MGQGCLKQSGHTNSINFKPQTESTSSQSKNELSVNSTVELRHVLRNNSIINEVLLKLSTNDFQLLLKVFRSYCLQYKIFQHLIGNPWHRLYLSSEQLWEIFQSGTNVDNKYRSLCHPTDSYQFMTSIECDTNNSALFSNWFSQKQLFHAFCYRDTIIQDGHSTDPTAMSPNIPANQSTIQTFFGGLTSNIHFSSSHPLPLKPLETNPVPPSNDILIFQDFCIAMSILLRGNFIEMLTFQYILFSTFIDDESSQPDLLRPSENLESHLKSHNFPESYIMNGMQLIQSILFIWWYGRASNSSIHFSKIFQQNENNSRYFPVHIVLNYMMQHEKGEIFHFVTMAEMSQSLLNASFTFQEFTKLINEHTGHPKLIKRPTFQPNATDGNISMILTDLLTYLGIENFKFHLKCGLRSLVDIVLPSPYKILQPVSELFMNPILQKWCEKVSYMHRTSHPNHFETFETFLIDARWFELWCQFMHVTPLFLSEPSKKTAADDSAKAQRIPLIIGLTCQFKSSIGSNNQLFYIDNYSHYHDLLHNQHSLETPILHNDLFICETDPIHGIHQFVSSSSELVPWFGEDSLSGINNDALYYVLLPAEIGRFLYQFYDPNAKYKISASLYQRQIILCNGKPFVSSTHPDSITSDEDTVHHFLLNHQATPSIIYQPSFELQIPMLWCHRVGLPVAVSSHNLSLNASQVFVLQSQSIFYRSGKTNPSSGNSASFASSLYDVHATVTLKSMLEYYLKSIGNNVPQDISDYRIWALYGRDQSFYSKLNPEEEDGAGSEIGFEAVEFNIARKIPQTNATTWRLITKPNELNHWNEPLYEFLFYHSQRQQHHPHRKHIPLASKTNAGKSYPSSPHVSSSQRSPLKSQSILVASDTSSKLNPTMSFKSTGSTTPRVPPITSDGYLSQNYSKSSDVFPCLGFMIECVNTQHEWPTDRYLPKAILKTNLPDHNSESNHSSAYHVGQLVDVLVSTATLLPKFTWKIGKIISISRETCTVDHEHLRIALTIQIISRIEAKDLINKMITNHTFTSNSNVFNSIEYSNDVQEVVMEISSNWDPLLNKQSYSPPFGEDTILHLPYNSPRIVPYGSFTDISLEYFRYGIPPTLIESRLVGGMLESYGVTATIPVDNTVGKVDDVEVIEQTNDVNVSELNKSSPTTSLPPNGVGYFAINLLRQSTNSKLGSILPYNDELVDVGIALSPIKSCEELVIIPDKFEISTGLDVDKLESDLAHAQLGNDAEGEDGISNKLDGIAISEDDLLKSDEEDEEDSGSESTIPKDLNLVSKSGSFYNATGKKVIGATPVEDSTKYPPITVSIIPSKFARINFIFDTLPLSVQKQLDSHINGLPTIPLHSNSMQYLMAMRKFDLILQNTMHSIEIDSIPTTTQPTTTMESMLSSEVSHKVSTKFSSKTSVSNVILTVESNNNTTAFDTIIPDDPLKKKTPNTKSNVNAIHELFDMWTDSLNLLKIMLTPKSTNNPKPQTQKAQSFRISRSKYEAMLASYEKKGRRTIITKPIDVIPSQSNAIRFKRQDIITDIQRKESSIVSSHLLLGSYGLNNLGNTCYMSAALQCILRAPYIASYFLSNQYLDNVNGQNRLGTQGILVNEFAKFISWAYNFHNLGVIYHSNMSQVSRQTDSRIFRHFSFSSLSPYTLLRTFQRFKPQFSGTEQQDSQEFLTELLDTLHEDLKRPVKELPPREDEVRLDSMSGEKDLDLNPLNMLDRKSIVVHHENTMESNDSIPNKSLSSNDQESIQSSNDLLRQSSVVMLRSQSSGISGVVPNSSKKSISSLNLYATTTILPSECNLSDVLLQGDNHWKNYQMKNNSLISDLFQGQLCTQITCKDCKKSSLTFEPFTSLSLSIPKLTPRNIVESGGMIPLETDTPQQITVMITFYRKLPRLFLWKRLQRIVRERKLMANAQDFTNENLVSDDYLNRFIRFIAQPIQLVYQVNKTSTVLDIKIRTVQILNSIHRIAADTGPSSPFEANKLNHAHITAIEIIKPSRIRKILENKDIIMSLFLNKESDVSTGSVYQMVLIENIKNIPYLVSLSPSKLSEPVLIDTSEGINDSFILSTGNPMDTTQTSKNMQVISSQLKQSPQQPHSYLSLLMSRTLPLTPVYLPRLVTTATLRELSIETNAYFDEFEYDPRFAYYVDTRFHPEGLLLCDLDYVYNSDSYPTQPPNSRHRFSVSKKPNSIHHQQAVVFAQNSSAISLLSTESLHPVQMQNAEPFTRQILLTNRNKPWPQLIAEFEMGERVDGCDHKGNWYAGTIVDVCMWQQSDIVANQLIVQHADLNMKINSKSSTVGSTKANKSSAPTQNLIASGVYIRIHFDEFSHHWDEWFSQGDLDNGFVAPIYSQSRRKVRLIDLEIIQRKLYIEYFSEKKVTRVEMIDDVHPMLIQMESYRSSAHLYNTIQEQMIRFVAPEDTMQLLEHSFYEGMIEFNETDPRTVKKYQMPFDIHMHSVNNTLAIPINQHHLMSKRGSSYTSGSGAAHVGGNVYDLNAQQFRYFGHKYWEGSQLPRDPYRPLCNLFHAKLILTVDWYIISTPVNEIKFQTMTIGPSIKVIEDETYKEYLESQKLLREELLKKEEQDHDRTNPKTFRPGTVEDRRVGLSLDFCLKKFVKTEELEEDSWFCAHCKKLSSGTLYTTIHTLPDILILHLKRLVMDATGGGKIRTLIKFPMNGLNMKPFTTESMHKTNAQNESSRIETIDKSNNHPEDTNNDLVFDLFGTVNHFGGMYGGHYTATAKCDGIIVGPDHEKEVNHDGTSVDNNTTDTICTSEFNWEWNELINNIKEYVPHEDSLFNGDTGNQTSRFLSIHDNLWMKFDDDHVMELNNPSNPSMKDNPLYFNVVTDSAYLLFYKRRKLSNANMVQYS